MGHCETLLRDIKRLMLADDSMHDYKRVKTKFTRPPRGAGPTRYSKTEQCPHCLKLFSVQGINRHIEKCENEY
jgi:hypothetical protein